MFIEVLYTLSHAARLMASVLLSQTDSLVYQRLFAENRAASHLTGY